jgi:hypothetical protein
MVRGTSRRSFLEGRRDSFRQPCARLYPPSSPLARPGLATQLGPGRHAQVGVAKRACAYELTVGIRIGRCGSVLRIQRGGTPAHGQTGEFRFAVRSVPSRLVQGPLHYCELQGAHPLFGRGILEHVSPPRPGSLKRVVPVWGLGGSHNDTVKWPRPFRSSVPFRHCQAQAAGREVAADRREGCGRAE